MGKHAQKFREIIELLPKPTDAKGFTPEIAAMCLAQLANKAFHIIQEQEEIIEDLENEVNALQANAIESTPTPEWKPKGD
jgi:hypothetical protein